MFTRTAAVVRRVYEEHGTWLGGDVKQYHDDEAHRMVVEFIAGD